MGWVRNNIRNRTRLGINVLSSKRPRIWETVLLAIGLLIGSGCASFRLPAIDPSGQNILLPAPNYTTVNSHSLDGVHAGCRSLLDGLCRRGDPVFQSPPAAPNCELPPQLPNMAAVQSTPLPPADPVAPRVLVPGHCQDPAEAARDANQGLLGQTVSPSNPQAQVTLLPRQQIAQVGSEVIVTGGVCGADGHFRVREPLEWTISQGSVGNFVDAGQAVVGRLGLRGRMGELFAEPLPELLSNNYAVACTSKKPQVLTRGTPATTDDVVVESGQAWIGVTSPVEGATYVTLTAPDLDGWTQRTQTAIVHWVDGEWTLPPSRIVTGLTPQVLTTTIRRRISTSPIAGWVVRYQILDPVAMFEGGTTVQEVTTDAEGNASIQISPAVAAGGAARVQIQVIRPASGSEPDRLLIGEGTTTVTWTTSQLTVALRGPASAELNDNVTYQIDVTNPGTLATTDVLVRSLIPSGMELVASVPRGQPFGSRVDWTLLSLAPGQTQTFEVTYRAVKSGTVQHCVSAQAAGGTAVEDCVTTQIVADALYIEMRGPNPDVPLQVGQEIQYAVRITNRGDQTLPDVLLTDNFDPGLQHEQPTSPVEWPIGALRPGESRDIGLTFRIVRPGRHCHTLEATATGTPPASTTACIQATEPQTPAPTPPPTTSQGRLEVRKIGPQEMVEGAEADFYVIVENSGDAPLTNLVIVDEYEAPLEPVAVDPPYRNYSPNRIEWTVSQLAPGQSLSFQVLCKANYGNVERACSYATVRAAGLPEANAELCLPVLPRGNGVNRPNLDSTSRLPLVDPAGQRLTASGRGLTSLVRVPARESSVAPDAFPRGAAPLPRTDAASERSEPNAQTAPAPASSHRDHDPALPLQVTLDARGSRWRVGDVIEFLVVIRNPRQAADRDVVLSVELPPQLTFVKHYGPVNASERSADKRFMRMVPVRTLRSGESLEFTIVAHVAAPGHMSTRAMVQSLAAPAGILCEELVVAGP